MYTGWACLFKDLQQEDEPRPLDFCAFLFILKRILWGKLFWRNHPIDTLSLSLLILSCTTWPTLTFQYKTSFAKLNCLLLAYFSKKPSLLKLDWRHCCHKISWAFLVHACQARIILSLIMCQMILCVKKCCVNTNRHFQMERGVPSNNKLSPVQCGVAKVAKKL